MAQNKNNAQAKASELTQLLACPFCGGDAELQEVGTARGCWCIKCIKCWAKSVYVQEHEKQIAIDAWNQRSA